jgi:hypothetical protein
VFPAAMLFARKAAAACLQCPLDCPFRKVPATAMLPTLRGVGRAA